MYSKVVKRDERKNRMGIGSGRGRGRGRGRRRILLAVEGSMSTTAHTNTN